LAAELAARHPALVFRNPERLARGGAGQREERRRFIVFFGWDLVVLPGAELAARMAAYWRFRVHEVRDAEGRSAVDHLGERYGAAARVRGVDLPADLGEADTVGVVDDEGEGNCCWADFGVVQATVADPALAGRRYKAGWFERPVLPSVTPVSRVLADHYRPARRPSGGGKRR